MTRVVECTPSSHINEIESKAIKSLYPSLYIIAYITQAIRCVSEMYSTHSAVRWNNSITCKLGEVTAHVDLCSSVKPTLYLCRHRSERIQPPRLGELPTFTSTQDERECWFLEYERTLPQVQYIWVGCCRASSTNMPKEDDSGVLHTE